VYDCGALPTIPPVNWTLKMQQLRQFIRGRTSIDLLTISHFDDDHIAGVTELFRQVRVEALMLPYVPLWERLLIAFGKDLRPGDERFRFYINPGAFLRGIGGDNLGRIIEVEPGGEDGPSFDSDGGDFPREPDLGEGPWKFKAKTKFRTAAEQSGNAAAENDQQTETIASGQPWTVQGLWEFCPYNAPRRDEISAGFKANVEKMSDRLLHPPAGADLDAELRALKKFYDDEFGDKARPRNVISLFLYSGPVYSTWNNHKILSPDYATPSYYPGRYPCWYRVHAHAPGHSSKCSILYTGDGYLNTPKSFTSLNAALGSNRITNLGVVQVPHHGAKGNWQPGLAAKLDPVFCVFSSDPARGPTYHPDAEVLRDFWPHIPVQVNQAGASYCGWLQR